MEKFVFRHWNKGRTFFISDVLLSGAYLRTHEFTVYICTKEKSGKAFAVFSAGRAENIGQFPFTVKGYLDNGQMTRFWDNLHVNAVITVANGSFKSAVPQHLHALYTFRYSILMMC